MQDIYQNGNAFTFSVKRKTYACGLYWNPLGKPKDFVKDAKRIAKKDNLSYYSLRKSQTSAQVCLANKGETNLAGAIPFASLAVNAIETQNFEVDGKFERLRDWFGIFALPDGKHWALIGVNDGAIMPLAEVVCDRDEAIARLRDNYGIGRIGAVIGDESIVTGYHNPIPMTFDELIALAESKPKGMLPVMPLRNVDFQVSPAAIVLGVAAIAVAAAGGYGVYAYKKEVERKEQETAMEAARQAMLANQKVAVIKLPEPWATEPLPQDFAEACAGGLTPMLAPGGWELTSYKCSRASLNYEYKRGASNVGLLREQFKEASFDGAGDKATLNRGVKFWHFTNETVANGEEERMNVINAFQLIGVPAKITGRQIDVPQPQTNTIKLPGTGGNELPPPQPHWKEYDVLIGPTVLGPSYIARYLNGPGARIHEITYSPAGEWLYKGVLYAAK